MQKRLKIAAFSLVILIALLLFVLSQNRFSLYLRLWRVTLSGDNFKLTNFYTDQQGTALKRETLWGQSSTESISITKYESSNNKKIIADKRFILTSLYEPITSSYPGVITNVITCPNNLKPSEEKVANGSIFTLYAGERYNFGICSSDLIVYKSFYGIFDCRDKGVFGVEVFTKTNLSEAKKVIHSFSC